MRVKCPNSDIILELPDEKMDMKFTCPSCHQVHRVTISIVTPAPGEQVVSSKQTQQIPRKYATGAFAPVVDIPIDADFVLFDSNAHRQIGIDLGQATEVPQPTFFADSRLAGRKTEVRPRPIPPTPGVDGDSLAADPIREAALAAAGLTETPEQPPLSEPFPDSEPHAPVSPAASERSGGRGVLAAAIILVILGIAFLVWQEYRHNENRKVVVAELDDAERLARDGELSGAATAARTAGDVLLQDEKLITARHLWNRLAGLTTVLPPLPSDATSFAAAVDRHLERENLFTDFRQSLTSGWPEKLPLVLADGLDQATADQSLAQAMEQEVVSRLSALATGEAIAGLAPETALNQANNLSRSLSPLLSQAGKSDLRERLAAAARHQATVLSREIGTAIGEIAAAARRGEVTAVTNYLALRERLDNLPVALLQTSEYWPGLLDPARRPEHPGLEEVARLSGILATARHQAQAILGLDDVDDSLFPNLASKARDNASPSARGLAEATARLILDQEIQAEKLLTLRNDLYLQLQTENRRDRISPGTETAWRFLLATFANPAVTLDPASLRYDSQGVEINLSVNSVPLHIRMGEEDFNKTIRATALGYSLQVDWSPFFIKPLLWLSEMAQSLRAARVDPTLQPDWEVLEGPGELLGLSLNLPPPVLSAATPSAFGQVPPSRTGGQERQVFFRDRLWPVRESAPAQYLAKSEADFRLAAKRLHDGVMGDDSIPQALRQALNPILMGAYLPVDSRDYFDTAFCRRLLEADYLETFVRPLPPARRHDLAVFRTALGQLEAGRDEFQVDLDHGVLTAVVAGQAGVEASGDTDAFSGELLPRYTWRMELPEETVFISPLPSRFNYALSLAEHYPGQERLRPAGEPVTTVVRHALRGPLASYTRGGDRAEGDPALWEAALATDIGGPLSPVYGPPGWNFPLHVLVRNDQGDPLRLATLDGIVESPDFATVPASERRGAEDRWLDSTARTLETPGELGLIFHHFFRYCSDSPLPEQPKLIGSHYGLADSHQTVYESLERRWVGRFIGDCDDLAEFFQVITSRQGKLSHVMNLPSHAACGYVDLLPDNSRRFIVLQTGQVLQFNGQSLNEVVEAAYRYFDRNAGESHLTMDAVPILLRFADEETRTPFVLSARIYEDRPYAETMIRVQGYWHENVLYAAILAMREMLATDRDIGNIKELGSLYERVGMYDQSEELRQEELLRVADDPQAKLSVLMDLVELHLQDRNHPRALEYLHAMEEVMQRFTRDNNVPDFLRALAFRSQWAIAMAKLGEAGRAWELMKYDVELTRRQHGYLSEPVLRTLVAMYTNLSLNRAARGSLPAPEQTAMEVIGKELEDAFSRGVFTADDDYTRTIIRYFFLGRYAVARQGREAGLVELAKDGPYPEGERDHTQRGRDITPDDWSWFRIVPQLYHAVAMEFLDQVEYPGLFSPQAARPFLEDVGRAVRRGTGLGSDVAGFDDQMRAEVTLSFINRDLDLFRRTMLTLREKDYSRLYDDLALTFGFNCGLLPLNDFDRWIDAFREYFPGSQHYFKVVYRALDKGNYAHALKMAQATARFFPDSPLLVQEAEFIRSMVPELEARRLSRP